MTRDLYAKAAKIFLQAADLPAAERSQFLDLACGEHQELRSEVEELLRHDQPDPTSTRWDLA